MHHILYQQNEPRRVRTNAKLNKSPSDVVSPLPAPVIFDPLKDVFPVASAPSRLALLKFACRKQKSEHGGSIFFFQY